MSVNRLQNRSRARGCKGRKQQLPREFNPQIAQISADFEK
jgi:hypothetical protein